MQPHVVSVASSPSHSFSKATQPSIRLVAGLGVEGDAHMGMTVKHRSRVARDPTQPNLRQVHLIHAELFDELSQAGFEIRPGDLGENILTRGIALLEMPSGTRLRVGATAEIVITGLRNPCAQLDHFRPGLMHATLQRDACGDLVRKAGVMAIVHVGGDVSAGDAIRVTMPPLPHHRLAPV